MEPRHFYVISLPEMYIYININTASETLKRNTENNCRQQAARCHESGHESTERTIKKQRHRRLSWPESWSNLGNSLLKLCVLVNHCGVMLLGECGGTRTDDSLAAVVI